jgi:hypothetical protein
MDIYFANKAIDDYCRYFKEHSITEMFERSFKLTQPQMNKLDPRVHHAPLYLFDPESGAMFVCQKRGDIDRPNDYVCVKVAKAKRGL